jgi:hypothetical protein
LPRAAPRALLFFAEERAFDFPGRDFRATRFDLAAAAFDFAAREVDFAEWKLLFVARAFAPPDFFAAGLERLGCAFPRREDLADLFAVGKTARARLVLDFIRRTVVFTVRFTAGNTGSLLAAARPSAAPMTPPITAPTGPATAPSTAPVAAPAACFEMGGISIFS